MEAFSDIYYLHNNTLNKEGKIKKAEDLYRKLLIKNSKAIVINKRQTYKDFI